MESNKTYVEPEITDLGGIVEQTLGGEPINPAEDPLTAFVGDM